MSIELDKEIHNFVNYVTSVIHKVKYSWRILVIHHNSQLKMDIMLLQLVQEILTL